MILRNAHGLVKFVLMMALMAFVATPIVAEAHELAELAHECESTSVSDSSDTTGDETPAHSPHAHHCGPCHGHMISPSQQFIRQTAIAEKQIPEAMLRLPPPLVYGLFRPPRG